MSEKNVYIPPAPTKSGLYDPAYEHDACGVGFLADLKGRPSHQLIQHAIKALINLSHRGACGCDAETGDGAGILFQMPDAFLRQEAGKLKINLPAPGAYAVSMTLLPTDSAQAAAIAKEFERIAGEEGQQPLGWRDVPVVSSKIGPVARSNEPKMRQFFIGRGEQTAEGGAFERALYVIRRRIENWVAASALSQKDYFYVPSCSARTVVYKGMLTPQQLHDYYPDLSDSSLVTALVLYHSRYSTNTFPTWSLAHPFRYMAHNGEINTLRGNINWMRAREAAMKSELFGKNLAKLFPIAIEGGSDSAIFDNALELLVLAGRSLPHAMMMMIPEAYLGQPDMDPARRGFYEYHSCLMEPWDGPASIAFTDGTVIGATLDRNGLRPSRYIVTKNDLVIMASEVGVLDIPPAEIKSKGRLQPGRMFLVDMAKGRIVPDEEIKSEIATAKPYGKWVAKQRLKLEDLPEAEVKEAPLDVDGLLVRQRAFGYTQEDFTRLLIPMAAEAQQPIGSMGTDTPLAVLSERSQLLFNYFKQLFAQVSNPPIDPIREEIVTSKESLLGSEGNLLEETEQQARLLRVKGPTLTNAEMEKIRNLHRAGFKVKTIKMFFKRSEGEAGLKTAMDRICAEAEKAVDGGATILILSDRGVDAEQVPVPSLLATSGVHHHLIRAGKRTRCGLVVESGEPREVMHFCLLVGYGAGAVNPYMVYEAYAQLQREELLADKSGKAMDLEEAREHFIKAIDKGMVKTFAKMGISTLQSYRGAQIFESVGLNAEVVDPYFARTPSRIGGVGLNVIAREALNRHEVAFPPAKVAEINDIEQGGLYHWRRRGEYHMWNPETIQKLQWAVSRGEFSTFKEFSKAANEYSAKLCTLRGLLDFNFADGAVPLDEVEPAQDIVKRFCTGAMSLGSISREAHETLAIAMNRIGGKSNTGEGGEDPERFKPDANGDRRRSAIKQVASGRFGVTANYLTNADELQIKMAQGAKPGEGGELPGAKVSEYIGKTRYTTPGVGLISPPPHHDIYSIEDLAQLIFDLKNANPAAEVSVKLVSEVGVGTIAAGVAKGHAHRVLISGDSGGTGASPLSSIKHAGLPWELGIAETQQTLVRNNLRGRIRVQTDGQLKTGRDVLIAALLGAEEFGFSTAPLISLGCIMMRKCHLNTCPVGIATQDPELRKRFAGKPDQVVKYMFFVAEEVRELLAKLGYRKLDEVIGRVDLLKTKTFLDHWKARGLDLSALLVRPEVPASVATRCVSKPVDTLDGVLDWKLIERCKAALEYQSAVRVELPIKNSDRTTGTILSHHITRKWGEKSLPEDTIQITFHGSAGQSFGAFLTHGITMKVHGDANDYIGKGLSGGKLIVTPPRESTFVAEENIIIGNVALYGATGGQAYFRGLAGERFCVRNSGARTVVEGVGDHACEYMTGGVAVVLGKTGRNFAAGMSGGLAFVLDVDGKFKSRCNLEIVDLEPVQEDQDISLLHNLISRHVLYTESPVAQAVLDDWEANLGRFIKIFPKDYRRVLREQAEAQRQWELVNN